jgi:DICT domain-containing protein
VTSLTAAPGASLLPSAYDAVASRTRPQSRTKRDLLAASRLVEQAALRGGAHTVLVTFQDKQHLTTASRAAYARLARAGATVHAFARGLVSDYRPDTDGLRTVALLPDDPLALEWDIVVLGGSSSTAFVARDLAPGAPVRGADLDRRFDWVRTDEPELVQAAAEALLARVPSGR